MKRYTFILGAGASVDFGFPTGPDFVTKIIENYTRDNLRIENDDIRISHEYVQDFGSPIGGNINISRGYSFAILDALGFENAKVFDFVKRLSDSKVNSIDSFLESPSNSDLVDLGKAIVVILILSYEKLSLGDFYKNTWLKYFWSRCRDEVLGNSQNVNIQIITFNYDRLFEYYLYTAIESYSQQSDQEIAQILGAFRIWHVHGVIGNLPFQSSEKYIPFGQEHVYAKTIKEISKNLRLLGEADSDSRAKTSIELSRYFTESTSIFFLGFGFHRENIAKLFDGINPGNYICKGTGYGMGLAEIADARARINRIPGARISLDLRDVKIESFLKDHMLIEDGSGMYYEG